MKIFATLKNICLQPPAAGPLPPHGPRGLPAAPGHGLLLPAGRVRVDTQVQTRDTRDTRDT